MVRIFWDHSIYTHRRNVTDNHHISDTYEHKKNIFAYLRRPIHIKADAFHRRPHLVYFGQNGSYDMHGSPKK